MSSGGRVSPIRPAAESNGSKCPVSADAEITRLLEPENTTVSVNQDRRGDCEIAKRAAFRREFAELNAVRPMNQELGICQQGDVPIVLLFERPQLIDTIGAERHELDAERGELFRGFVELFHLGDAVSTSNP